MQVNSEALSGVVLLSLLTLGFLSYTPSRRPQCHFFFSILGGNSNPVDRILAQTMAFAYYWYVIVVYFVSEQAAYHLSELIEDHAYETYDGFVTNHGDRLKKMPVPAIANKYYEKDNPFLFDLFCTVKEAGADGTYSARRPKLESLYDVFVNVRDDGKFYGFVSVQQNDKSALYAAFTETYP